MSYIFSFLLFLGAHCEGLFSRPMGKSVPCRHPRFEKIKNQSDIGDPARKGKSGNTNLLLSSMVRWREEYDGLSLILILHSNSHIQGHVSEVLGRRYFN